MADRPRPQEIYRHFKGNMYQVLTIAIHSETREEMVVYQALYGDYKVYVRPLDMFMSEVDRDKYPDVKQKMRFEKVTPSDDVSERVVTPQPVKEPEKETEKEPIKKPMFNFKPTEKSVIMEKSVDEEAQELNLDPLVIQFMDADLASEKNDILAKLRPIITNDMIDIMALSVGVVVNEGDVYDRYNDLRTCLTTMEKFESTRLRS
ncbi:DUF1653 domain-containing protein [Butyrivibrio sp. NC2007]|uniref:DUF1653 domain-containing protein n=1 Tax=Butyrivibrio sp. NC2007 TaxID=1280683 RepID=UPI0003B5D2DF|nr:DUF1653 domain-containing protein [Butyrivibrio sp. NC2007]